MNPVVLRPVGEGAVLAQFADNLDDEAYARVIALDAALAAPPVHGIIETVPAYVSLLIRFDPLVITPGSVEAIVHARLATPGIRPPTPREHVVPVCYEPDFAPDLAEVGRRLLISPTDISTLHSSATYRVYMYGFAPGYAYMGGVPAPLQLPRKAAAERGHPSGSIIIAGQQCLITTLSMPTGWWVIGRTPLKILDPEKQEPFLFDAGDNVRFEAVTRQRFDELTAHD